MIFNPGQRVKRVRHCIDPIPLGSEGTVIADEGGLGVRVNWDAGYRFSSAYARETLEPIVPLDDKADTWAADKVKQVTRPRPVIVQGDIEHITVWP